MAAKRTEIGKLKLFVLVISHANGSNLEMMTRNTPLGVLREVGDLKEGQEVRNIFLIDGEGNSLPLSVEFKGRIRLFIKDGVELVEDDFKS